MQTRFSFIRAHLIKRRFLNPCSDEGISYQIWNIFIKRSTKPGCRWCLLRSSKTNLSLEYYNYHSSSFSCPISQPLIIFKGNGFLCKEVIVRIPDWPCMIVNYDNAVCPFFHQTNNLRNSGSRFSRIQQKWVRFSSSKSWSNSVGISTFPSPKFWYFLLFKFLYKSIYSVQL